MACDFEVIEIATEPEWTEHPEASPLGAMREVYGGESDRHYGMLTGEVYQVSVHWRRIVRIGDSFSAALLALPRDTVPGEMLKMPGAWLSTSPIVAIHMIESGLGIRSKEGSRFRVAPIEVGHEMRFQWARSFELPHAEVSYTKTGDDTGVWCTKTGDEWWEHDKA